MISIILDISSDGEFSFTQSSISFILMIIWVSNAEVPFWIVLADDCSDVRAGSSTKPVCIKAASFTLRS